MKTLKILALLGLMSPVSLFAEANIDKIVRESDRTMYSKVNKSTEAVSIRLQYGGTSSEAYVSVLDTNMVFFAPLGTRDSGIGNNGQFDLSQSTNDTVGELCDVINAKSSSHKYECFIEDAKRNDNVNLLGNVLSTPTLSGGDLKANNGYELLFDNAAGDGYAGIPVMRFQSLGITPESGKRVILKKCEALVAGDSVIMASGRLWKFAAGKDGAASSDGLVRDDTTEVVELPIISSTTLVTNFVQSVGTGTVIGSTQFAPATLMDGAVEFDRDAHVVVRAGTAGSPNQAGNTVGQVVPRIGCSWDEK